MSEDECAEKQEEAKRLSEVAQKLKNDLIEAQESDDYDTLYMYFFSNSLPLVGSFNTNKIKDMTALKNNFGINNLSATIDNLKSKDHLYNVAKINVDKQYAK